MADRELIAATLGAGFLRPIEFAQGGSSQPRDQVFGRAAVHAVDLYVAILGELAKRQSSPP